MSEAFSFACFVSQHSPKEIKQASPCAIFDPILLSQTKISHHKRIVSLWDEISGLRKHDVTYLPLIHLVSLEQKTADDKVLSISDFCHDTKNYKTSVYTLRKQNKQTKKKPLSIRWCKSTIEVQSIKLLTKYPMFNITWTLFI